VIIFVENDEGAIVAHKQRNINKTTKQQQRHIT